MRPWKRVGAQCDARDLRACCLRTQPRSAFVKSVLLCAAFVTALTAASDSHGVATRVTGENGRIAFEGHDASGRPEIWTMNQDGSDPRRIGLGRDPAWSPDGSRIVFVSSDNEIALVRPDGSDQRRVEIVDPPYDVVNPAVSPDGGTIAFGGRDGLYVAPYRGGTARQLAAVGGTLTPVAPSWSHDGRRIAVLQAGNATYRRSGHLFVIGADGSGLTEVSSAQAPQGEQATWAPDGATIVYGDVGGGISTVGRDGSAPKVLVLHGGLRASDPAWSPDGARVAFVGNNTDICVVNADGTGVGRLTWTGGNTDPAWQPFAAGTPPAGMPVAPSGPPASWDRNRSWGTACALEQYPGKTLTGRVDRVRASVGAIITYRLRLANRGDVPIGDDAMASFWATLDGGAHVVSVAASRGKCVVDDPLEYDRPVLGIECRFGSLFPGEHEDVTVRAKARSPGEVKLEGFLSTWVAGANRIRLQSVVLRRTAISGCTVRGTERANVLSGSPRADVICGLDGRDRIRSGVGRDRVYAGPDADVVSARDGQLDVVSCGSGLDSVTADEFDRIASDCERVER
jgi:RTX calcium-binding nonapeptide repeat (4 copies)/WD40-like Beta Propeller Repeat